VRALGAMVVTGVVIAGVFASSASTSFPGRVGRIAFDRPQDANVEIYSMNADGSDIRNLSNNPASDNDPRYSADGSRITFVSNRDGNWEIYAMNSDGSGQTRLTFNPAVEAVPAFTADGRIVFVSDRDGNHELYVMDADGGNVQRLTSDPALDHFPAPAPHGDEVAFLSDRDGTFDIYVTTTRGGPARRVTDSPIADTWPIWSPRGNDIAFTRWQGTNHDLYTVHQDGTQLTRLTDTPSRDELAPAWSPDGRQLVYLGCTAGDCDLLVRNADGSGPESTLLHGGAGAPDWQPLAPPPTGGFAAESALAPAASSVAQKPVTVDCPASRAIWDQFIASLSDREARDGFGVSFEVGGSETFLSFDSCRTLLDRLARHRVETAPLATAIEILVHEAVHLRGEDDESLTDCTALREMPNVAVHFFGFSYKPKKRAALRALMASAWVDHRGKPAEYRTRC
jgi:Tol biopolymer transport system component